MPVPAGELQGSLARLSGGAEDEGQHADDRSADAAARRAERRAAQAVGRERRSCWRRFPTKHPESPLARRSALRAGLGQAEPRPDRRGAEGLRSRGDEVARSRRRTGPLHDGRVAISRRRSTTKRSASFSGPCTATAASRPRAETKNWQAKSGYEAGRCAEVQITAAKDAAAKQKHMADAKRFYTFVAEKHASHELAAEAKKRLERTEQAVSPTRISESRMNVRQVEFAARRLCCDWALYLLAGDGRCWRCVWSLPGRDRLAGPAAQRRRVAGPSGEPAADRRRAAAQPPPPSRRTSRSTSSSWRSRAASS